MIEVRNALCINCEEAKSHMMVKGVRSHKHKRGDDMIEPVFGSSSPSLLNSFVSKDAPAEAPPMESLKHTSDVGTMIGVGSLQVISDCDWHRHVLRVYP